MKCVRCDRLSVGKSKYCGEHRAAARAAWKENVQRSADDRAARVASFDQVWRDASAAAGVAYRACVPAGVIVYETAGLSNVPKVDGQVWEVSEGVCGFAWIHFGKATSSFVRWLAKCGRGRKAYYGGWDVQSWELVADDRGQSYDRKLAAMQAAVEVFRAAGIECYADSRLD